MENHDSQFKTKAKERRRRMTPEEFDLFSGKQNAMLKKSQQKYKIAKREADKQVKDWEKAYG